MRARFTRDHRSYKAGDVVTDTPSEATLRCPLVYAPWFLEWRQEGILEGLANAKILPPPTARPAAPLAPSPAADVSPAKARALGRKAKADKLTSAANPFRRGTAQASAWLDGLGGAAKATPAKRSQSKPKTPEGNA